MEKGRGWNWDEEVGGEDEYYRRMKWVEIWVSLMRMKKWKIYEVRYKVLGVCS